MDVDRGLDHGADRAQRRRQDHLLQPDHRLLPARQGRAVFDGREVQGRPPYTIARLGMVRTFQITKALAAMPVIDNMMLAAPDQPGEKLANVVFRPFGWRGTRARGPRAGDRAARRLQPHPARRRVRRDALRRPAQAARARAGADGRAALPAPRRADGGHQPDPRPPAARPHAAAARRGRRHLPVHRARHGGGHEPLRPGDRDGRGRGDRRRRAARGALRPGRDRRLPRRRRERQREPDRERGWPTGEVVLQAEGVVAGYIPEVDILNGVSIDVREGEIVTIVGPNGAGKST